MRPGAVVLVMAAALLHAMWNLRLHASEDRAAVMAGAGLLTALALAPFVVADPPSEVWPAVVVSGLAETAYVLALSAAYRRGDLSLTYPVGRGVAPVLATAGAWLVFGERPAGIAAAGAVCMAAGLSLLAAEARRARSLEAVGYALLVALTIAVYSVNDAHAVHRVSPLGYLGASFAIQGLVTAAVARRRGESLVAALPASASVAVASGTAYLLVLFAFRVAPVGRVSTLREVSVLLALILGSERVARRRWVGAALCVGGAILAAA